MTPHEKMHPDEVDIHADAVAQLLQAQFPQYAGLPIRRVASTGTVNAIYRLGDDLCIRLPRLAWAEEALQREWHVLPLVAKHVTCSVPHVVGTGKPGAGYPFSWAIYNWLPGHIYDASLISEDETAAALAQFILQLRTIPLPNDAPKAGREPLRALDETTVTALAACLGDIDSEKALAVWHRLLDVKPWDGAPVWIHADLLKPNLLVDGGRLCAVIDFGSAGVGDPAFDVIPAWTVLTAKTRPVFRLRLAVDEDTWLRAKAYALHQAALIIPYYRTSNPAFAAQARQTVCNILLD